ncbi:MAG: methylated-DNA--[protein]-cysteine S-methyltransferase [Psychroflexus sp.]|nr:methylated-DNA--[protein]-cysteine S-methyltransferase [Psychroflexus sp.]MDN6310560.1 methylated-DNA--[protein]-cysteine S-methyltransferase [Psychroflexus sp.]
MNTNTIFINRLTTPLGSMFIYATDKGICLLEFEDKQLLDKEFDNLKKSRKADIISGENEHIKQAEKEIKEYFGGKRKTFDVKLDIITGTDFQLSVWKSLQDIDYGTTTTYQKQAEKINKPKAIRAMASANGNNRISIIIPCHRVIGKNGQMTGYSGGIERKKWLIAHERNDVNPQLRLL